MSAQLKKANPQAYANVLRRCLEAVGRGMWAPDEAVVQELRRRYAEMDDELEGVAGPAGGASASNAARAPASKSAAPLPPKQQQR